MLNETSPFSLFMLRFLAARTLGLIGLVEEILFGRLDQRLAALLLSKGSVICTTHQGLADELGSTREAISRTLESFEEQRLVALARGHITVLDRARVEKIARTVR